MITVRALTPSDYEAWLPLWRGYLEFYETELSTEQTQHTFERLTATDGTMHGAIALSEEGTPLGMVTWLTHPNTWSSKDNCYLEDLFVSAGARGTGVGRALIQHVEEWATSAGANKVYWLTAESNKTAQQLYDRIAVKSGFIHYQIANLGARSEV